MKDYKSLAGTKMRYIGDRPRMTPNKSYNIVSEEMWWDADHSDYWAEFDFQEPKLLPEFYHYLKVYDDDGHPATIERKDFEELNKSNDEFTE